MSANDSFLHVSERTPLLRENCEGIRNRPNDLELPRETTPAGEDDVPLVKELSTGKLLVVMGSVWFGTFIAALDSTIIATLTSPISTSFNSLSLISWIASSYFIANAALQPLSGRLTDILSRRTGLIFANIFFAVGNLICGLSRTEIEMIFGRVIAGIGGGGLNAIGTFVGSDLVPLRKRGLWQGYGNLTFGLGASVGGVLGGRINDVWGWRAAFLFQVPLTFISGIITFFAVKIPVKKTDKSTWKRIDYLGAVTLIVALVLLLLGVNSGGNIVPWTHPLVLITLPLSVVCLSVFLYVESNIAPEPIIPVRLMVNRTVLSACLTNWFCTMAQYVVFFYGPIYFESVKDMSATEAGARMMPVSVGIGVGSVGSGIIMRSTGRYYFLSVCVLAIFCASLAIFSTFGIETPAWEPLIVLFLVGLGFSGMLTITLLALIAAVDHEHQAVVTSASYAFRSTGAVFGVTIASTVFQNILKVELFRKLGDRKGAAEVIRRLRDSLDEIRNLPPDWKIEVKNVYAYGFRGVFLTAFGLGLLALLVSLFMREHTLHKSLSRK
ncbi:MAG: hypothetical protein LQ342_007236 [Letrouitia transgressa]|nr:MAG: hypothetical protein LQ342_007236 [Letrouitia transgressa]